MIKTNFKNLSVGDIFCTKINLNKRISDKVLNISDGYIILTRGADLHNSKRVKMKDEEVYLLRNSEPTDKEKSFIQKRFKV